MKIPILWAFLACFPALSPLWAAPASLENFDYRINLSETMPGVDNAPASVGGPVIYVDATDKLRSTTTRFPLAVYSINEYFLSDDRLNLLCRTTPRDTTQQRFTLIQLNLSNTPDSRQFQGLEKFFFSPDNQSLLGVFNKDGTGETLGLIRLGGGPARLGLLYSREARVNLFQGALPAIGKDIALASVVGWAADALTAAFLLRADEGTPDAPALRYYLAGLYLEGDRFQVAVEPVDLSAYHVPDSGVIDQVDCVGDQATLTFPPSDSFKNPKAVFKLPKPADDPGH